jgi:hypothetical protein
VFKACYCLYRIFALALPLLPLLLQSLTVCSPSSLSLSLVSSHSSSPRYPLPATRRLTHLLLLANMSSDEESGDAYVVVCHCRQAGLDFFSSLRERARESCKFWLCEFRCVNGGAGYAIGVEQTVNPTTTTYHHQYFVGVQLCFVCCPMQSSLCFVAIHQHIRDCRWLCTTP